jgi:hypothetical protein
LVSCVSTERVEGRVGGWLALAPRAFVDGDAGVSRDVVDGDEHAVARDELRDGDGFAEAVVVGAHETDGFGVLEEDGDVRAGALDAGFDEDERAAFYFHARDVGDARATVKVAA